VRHERTLYNKCTRGALYIPYRKGMKLPEMVVSAVG
jgi:hypothetical protein